jgi:hypothetical protein
MTASSEIHSLLMEVSLSGAAIIPKAKLLWNLGWAQERPGAWRTLLDYWGELGGDPKGLHAIEASDMIILLADLKYVRLVSDLGGIAVANAPSATRRSRRRVA